MCIRGAGDSGQGFPQKARRVRHRGAVALLGLLTVAVGFYIFGHVMVGPPVDFAGWLLIAVLPVASTQHAISICSGTRRQGMPFYG